MIVFYNEANYTYCVRLRQIAIQDEYNTISIVNNDLSILVTLHIER